MIDRFKLRPELDSALGIDLWCTGYQARASIDGETILDVAIGCDATGQSLKSDDVFAVYCAGKPYLALLVASLVDRKELSLDDVVGDLTHRAVSATVGQLTVRQLLSHTAGLDDLLALPYRLLSPTARTARIASVHVDSDLIGRPQYTEFLAWQILQMSIEDLTNLSFADALQEFLLTPWSIEVFFGFSESDVQNKSRIRLNADMQRRRPAPLLWERSESNLADVRASDGCYVSMTGLERLYQRTLAALSGQDPTISRATMHELTLAPPAVARHTLLGRKAGFGLGFMTGLPDHHFGRNHSRSSYGHSGFAGLTFAAAEPSIGLTYAVHANGVTGWSAGPDLAKRPELRRQRVSDILLARSQ